MSSDYPDWTDLVQIVGTDIMVAVDLQGAYIMMPVDIQAQYITLEIDIVAQTVGNISIDIAAQSVTNLSVNLAASAITMDINIASITGGVTFNIGTVTGTVNVSIASIAGGVTFNIGSITGTVTVNVTGIANIDIETQSVAVKDQAEWAALTGIDKNFTASGSNLTKGQSAYGSYTVTTGKTLYICGASFSIYANLAASADLNQIGFGWLYNYTDAITLAEFGGNGGGSITFPKPIPLAAGREFRYFAIVEANHACDAVVSVWGYEV